MNSAPRRIVLFLACAAVLLAAGFLWGSSHEYDQFYSSEASLDRELVHLEFNTRVLHHLNANEPAQSRRELVGQLRQQMVYVGSFLAGAPSEVRQNAEHQLRQAGEAIAGLPAAASPGPVARNSR